MFCFVAQHLSWHLPALPTSNPLSWRVWFVSVLFFLPSLHFKPASPPNKTPSNLSHFVETKDPLSGFDELVNPEPRSVVRAGFMMAQSLKGWSDGFIGQERKTRLSGGLVIGLIYPQSPECRLPQLAVFIAGCVSLFKEQKMYLWRVLVPMCVSVYLDVPLHYFPPVVDVNEAPKTMESDYCAFLSESL